MTCTLTGRIITSHKSMGTENSGWGNFSYLFLAFPLGSSRLFQDWIFYIPIYLKNYLICSNCNYLTLICNSRCSCIDTTQAQQMSKEWTLDMDCALVKHINTLCRHLAISPSRLHPHEVYLTEAELSSANYSCLQGRYMLI